MAGSVLGAGLGIHASAFARPLAAPVAAQVVHWSSSARNVAGAGAGAVAGCVEFPSSFGPAVAGMGWRSRRRASRSIARVSRTGSAGCRMFCISACSKSGSGATRVGVPGAAVVLAVAVAVAVPRLGADAAATAAVAAGWVSSCGAGSRALNGLLALAPTVWVDSVGASAGGPNGLATAVTLLALASSSVAVSETASGAVDALIVVTVADGAGATASVCGGASIQPNVATPRTHRPPTSIARRSLDRRGRRGMGLGTASARMRAGWLPGAGCCDPAPAIRLGRRGLASCRSTWTPFRSGHYRITRPHSGMWCGSRQIPSPGKVPRDCCLDAAVVRRAVASGLVAAV